MTVEDVYKENYNIVYGYLFTLCNNRSLAEELAAETFLKFAEKPDRYNQKCKLSSYLCKIAKNEYLKYYNKHKKLKSIDEYGDIEDSRDLQQILVDKSLTMQIHKILHDLQNPYKEVFNLRVFAELPFADIGEIFEKSATWARVTYYRAKIKILEKLEDSHGKGL